MLNSNFLGLQKIAKIHSISKPSWRAAANIKRLAGKVNPDRVSYTPEALAGHSFSHKMLQMMD
jgi:hypothetical protein